MRRAWLVLTLLAAQSVSAGAQPGDWSVQRDPFDRTLIARYKAMLSRSPHDRLALSALVSLYKRHRSVDLLVKEYEAAQANGPDAPGLVVLARIARSRGDAKRARELFERAAALGPVDAATSLAIGELAVTAGDRAAARAAFTDAAALANAPAVPAAARASRPASPAVREAALRALASLSVADRDVATVERVHDELARLRPRDVLLWTERGDALLALSSFDRALDAYAKAETLFARDPERKLLAISDRGRAFEKAGKTDEAVAEYDRAIAASPGGYYLRRELTLRIIELVRKHVSIEAALAEVDRRWPASKRDAFEWSTVADLYEQSGAMPMRTAALEAAATKAPRDTVIQWKLIRQYDRTSLPQSALAQLETAVRASPRDLALVLELAQRVELASRLRQDRTDDVAPRALRLLQQLSRAYPRDADAHAAIGEVYARWNEPARAVSEYTVAARLEPTDDRLVALGDAHAENGDLPQAIETWERLGASGSAKGLARLATVLADHALWDQAVYAFTKAVEKDPKSPALWKGRGLALAEGDHWYSAITDVEYALSLQGPVPYEQGFETRVALVRILGRMMDTEGASSYATLRGYLVRWSAAFRAAKPDLQAGYLLAAYFGIHHGDSLVPVLLRLQSLVPTDAGVTAQLIRAYRLEHRYDDAIAVARTLGKQQPARAKDMAELVTSIEIDRKHHLEDEARRALDPTDDIDGILLDRWARRGSSRRVPLIAGARLGLGAGIGAASERSMTLGSWDAVPLTRHVDAIVRADWAQHVGNMRSVNAIALGLGMGRHGMISADTAVMASAGLRAELRIGLPSDDTWTRWYAAADAGVDITSRHLPASLGVRWEKGLSAPGSSILVEVSVGFRCLDFSGGSAACR
jgi:tetratricopeptide (TPR) repeat protein